MGCSRFTDFDPNSYGLVFGKVEGVDHPEKYELALFPGQEGLWACDPRTNWQRYPVAKDGSWSSATLAPTSGVALLLVKPGYTSTTSNPFLFTDDMITMTLCAGTSMQVRITHVVEVTGGWELYGDVLDHDPTRPCKIGFGAVQARFDTYPYRAGFATIDSFGRWGPAFVSRQSSQGAPDGAPEE